MVVSWLRNSVNFKISASIMYIDDAHLIWNDLRDRFSQGNMARVCQLKQQLRNMRQESEDIRSQIISMIPFSSLSRIFAMVLQEERQRSIEFVPQPPQINTENSGSMINVMGYARGRNAKGIFLCTKCGKTNHIVDKCFEIIGYPPGYGRGRGKTQLDSGRSVNQVSGAESGNLSKASGIMTTVDMAQSSNDYAPTNTSPPFSGTVSLAPLICSIFSSTLWLLDTGATHDVCNNPSLFTNNSNNSNAHVNLPNGTITLTPNLQLDYVLCVPTFSYNLISEASQGTVIGKGSKVGNLYVLQTDPATFTKVTFPNISASAGPYSSSTVDGYTYFFTIVDDYSRVPSSVLPDNATPFQMLFRKPPSYTHLRVFGCLCNMSTLDRHRSKFSPRVVKCVFLGYPSGYKGYKTPSQIPEPQFTFPVDTSIPNNIFSQAQPQSASTLPNTNEAGTDADSTSDATSMSDVLPTTQLGGIRKPPYICNSVICSPYPLHKYISYSKLSSAYFRLAELEALIKNDTWFITLLPLGKIAIGCNYKARLVAKGYTQQARVDFIDIFSPVAKLVTVKVMLSLEAISGWSLCHLDINNAFLYGELSEDIYMELPPGLVDERSQPYPAGSVCKLKRSLYGLKQASRQWYLKFSKVLAKFGLCQSTGDHSFFYKKSQGKFLGLIVYVDDILLTSNDARNDKGIYLCQRKYVLDLLKDAGLLNCRPASSPMESGKHLSLIEGAELPDPTKYRRLIGDCYTYV
ncbi:uncharacterized protein LOC131018304 [Salvia miltiorrhiza]|uniref:uncharacterized protein LOC131018304 n=1 Tax=Salvia miltiorrhiza TaxID=226208 RepID=UPI0025AD8F3B|nr:uncharacterized protein LOC131018304 [Salvia miltiorrhiza]